MWKNRAKIQIFRETSDFAAGTTRFSIDKTHKAGLGGGHTKQMFHIFAMFSIFADTTIRF